MASVRCTNCGSSIRYHGEPKHIIHYLIDSDDWKAITSMEFDATNKIIDKNSGYPKRFYSDTIEEDFSECVREFWKCPECDALMAFNARGALDALFVPTDDECFDISDMENYSVLFDDFMWDYITEAAVPNTKIHELVEIDNRIYFFEKGIAWQDNNLGKVVYYKRII